MEMSKRPWGDVKESDYKDAAAFCAACLIDMNDPGKPKSKDKCKLPVKEPGGAVNRNAMHAAWAALNGARGGVDAPAPEKKKAARKLMSMYRSAGEEVPPDMARMAG